MNKLLLVWTVIIALNFIFQIADLANEDTPQLYTLCGRGPRSSLRVLRHGLEVIYDNQQGIHNITLSFRNALKWCLPCFTWHIWLKLSQYWSMHYRCLFLKFHYISVFVVFSFKKILTLQWSIEKFLYLNEFLQSFVSVDKVIVTNMWHAKIKPWFIIDLSLLILLKKSDFTPFVFVSASHYYIFVNTLYQFLIYRCLKWLYQSCLVTPMLYGQWKNILMVSCIVYFQSIRQSLYTATFFQNWILQ